MSTVIYVTPEGERREVVAHDGETVMRAAVRNLVPGIIAECGGELSCATCHVFVDESWVKRIPPISDIEEEMLAVAATEPTPVSRLSCQLTCGADTEGLIVRIPEEQ